MFDWIKNLFRRKKAETVVHPSQAAIHEEQEAHFAKHGRYLQTPHVDVYEAPNPDRRGTTHGYRIRSL